ncbi:MAG: PAS domain S-box protein [Phycisphaerae bacterium]|jgi:PAS domain S-box-containing protein|nr:PAS domain S-box protein [Phycisphaerae bacterium]
MDSDNPASDQLKREIDNLRRQVAELTVSRDRFRDMVESTSDWIWEVDHDAKYTYASPRVKDILGREPADLIGTTPFDIMPPDEAKRIAEAFQDIVDHKAPLVRLENICLHADGREMVMETSGVPVHGPDGQFLGYRGVDRDITDRKRAEQALRSEKDFSTTLVQASPAFIVAIAPDGTTIMMNESMRRELGYSEDEVVGADYLTTFVPEADRAQLADVFRTLTATTEPTTNENRVLTRDGRELVVEWHGQQMFDPDGNVEYFIGVGIDITERKQAEEDRDSLEEQLRQAQKMEAVGQLAGGIAHDFNNILTAILGNAELLKMDLSDEAEHVEFTDEIVKGAKRAADLTRQLLAFARKGQWQVIPVDLHAIIRQTVKMLTHSIDRRIEIRQELQALSSMVMGDPSQLQNALLNLGVNARDAMVDGGTLTYSTQNITLTKTECDKHPYELAPGDFLEISVTDTGIGMDAQTQKRIFEPFFTTKDVGKGTGLGLAGVYGCLRSHDGGVIVSSQPGQGAVFTVLLPLAETDGGTAQTTADHAPVGGTGHILVVDDEQSVRNFVRTSLQNLGYTVSAEAEGSAGVDYYREHYQDIDLVIIDLIMPRMSGQDAFREMKKINPDARILVSSGFSYTQATRQMLNEGAVGLLNKPFQITELSKTVARHIRPDRQ